MTDMFNQLSKLRRSISTKGERRIGEILKNNRIKFKTKIKIGRYEVDFIIGRVVIEVDGSVHKRTNNSKDIYLIKKGYIPLHVSGGKKAVEKDLIYLIKANN
jgi:very-short-patch-repair endonuclease